MKKIFSTLRLLIPASSILVMSGCANNAQSPHIIKGTYIWGPEVREFAACGGAPAIWAEGNSEVMKPIVNAVVEKSSKANSPWQPVYVEMEIKMLNDPPNGFAEDYSATAEIVKVFNVSIDIPDGCISEVSDKAPVP
ncbi:TPA: hypothetical protein U0F11_004003 [Escherichia coli]|nr:hypothetical protein [Escherichia coli]HEL8550147.1 hypothetical protein [Escherichia coli]HEM0025819.1 hypothetical protein [Escherichia coli]